MKAIFMELTAISFAKAAENLMKQTFSHLNTWKSKHYNGLGILKEIKVETCTWSLRNNCLYLYHFSVTSFIYIRNTIKKARSKHVM